MRNRLKKSEFALSESSLITAKLKIKSRKYDEMFHCFVSSDVWCTLYFEIIINNFDLSKEPNKNRQKSKQSNIQKNSKYVY